MRFERLILADDGKGHLPGLDVLQSFAAGNQFTVRRKNRGDPNDVARRNSGIAQRQFKTGKPLSVFTYAFGEENLLRDECHVGTELRCLQKLREITSHRKLTSTRGDVNGIQARLARERNRIAHSHFSNNCFFGIGLASRRNSRTKKRGRVVRRALFPCRFGFWFRLTSVSKDIRGRSSPAVAVVDSIPGRNNTGTDDTAGDSSRCAVAVTVDSPPASPDEMPAARVPCLSSPAVRS